MKARICWKVGRTEPVRVQDRLATDTAIASGRGHLGCGLVPHCRGLVETGYLVSTGVCTPDTGTGILTSLKENMT